MTERTTLVLQFAPNLAVGLHMREMLIFGILAHCTMTLYIGIFSPAHIIRVIYHFV